MAYLRGRRWGRKLYLAKVFTQWCTRTIALYCERLCVVSRPPHTYRLIKETYARDLFEYLLAGAPE